MGNNPNVAQVSDASFDGDILKSETFGSAMSSGANDGMSIASRASTSIIGPRTCRS